jgi:hypothetical protein
MDANSMKDLHDLKMENEYKAFSRLKFRPKLRDNPAKFLEQNKDHRARMKFFHPSVDVYQFGLPIGRIFMIPDLGFELNAFGSRFLIALRVLLTNFEVLAYPSKAKG